MRPLVPVSASARIGLGTAFFIAFVAVWAAVTLTAIISPSWKKEPMKITASFCASPMPAHRISSGMNADAGR